MRCLITGGTGFLGHRLVPYLLTETDWNLIVLSRDEYKQAVMREEFPDPRVEFRLGDVRDRERLEWALYGVDYVVHAAALKRVDDTAGDPMEVFRTNWMGTDAVLRAATRNHVARVLVISTDKACEPINAYGISKAAAESVTVAWNQYGIPQGTRASVLRYGNVWGSRGSVAEIWAAQVRAGQAPTLTHPEMTRFLISSGGAVRLVHACLDAMEGGEIFVPLLPRARLVDVCRVVTGGAHPQEIGRRRGGEKVHECLISSEEAARAWLLGPYMVLIEPHQHPWRREWEIDAARWTEGSLRSDREPLMTEESLRGWLAR